MMTEADYSDTQATLVSLASLALLLDLDAFLDAIAKAEAVGPILDPTLYMRGARKMEQVRELAVAVREVQRVARQHAETREARDAKPETTTLVGDRDGASLAHRATAPPCVDHFVDAEGVDPHLRDRPPQPLPA